MYKEGESLRTVLLIGFFCLLFKWFYKVNTFTWKKIIPIWLFTVLIAGLIITSIVINFKYVTIEHQPDAFLSYLVLQYLLLPLLILFVLNSYYHVRSWLKLAGIFLTAFLLSILERLVEWVGIIHYRNWHFGFSFLLWLFIAIGSLSFYHFILSNLFQKDVDHV